MANNLRALVVGASTLLGKELIEELNGSSIRWDLRVTEAADSGGQLLAGADEAFIVQPLTPDVFVGQDVVFFAESVQSTRAHWREAQRAHASVVDLTGALTSEGHALVRSPWIVGGRVPDPTTAVIVPAHPAAVMLGSIGSRLVNAFGRATLAATVLEPASQQGTRGMDELHQQAVNLLGFHAPPHVLYDSQVVFNLQTSLGEAATVNLGTIAETIRGDIKAIAGDAVASGIAIQLVQAPVFHGYMMSVFAELPDSTDDVTLSNVLSGGVIRMTARGEDPASNQSVAQDAYINVALRQAEVRRDGTRRYWLWIGADNLKLAARHAVACAEELSTVRSSGQMHSDSDG